MATWSPHLYRIEAQRRGLTEKTIGASLECVTRLEANSIPPVLTLRHLAQQVEVDYLALRELIERRHESPYRVFQISKRIGGYRTICVPCPELLRTQRWIHTHVLSHQAVHPNSYAFHGKGGILDCAKRHCRARWLVKLDVRQFFESISERQVFRTFVTLGFGRLLAFELSRLCTRQTNSRTRRSLQRWQSKSGYRFHQTTFDTIGHLPQGAPTSPMLSNLTMYALDRALEEYASTHALCVTRYADDIVFSTSDNAFTRSNALKILADITSVLHRFGLMVNALKSTIVPPSARKIVLGLLVDSDRPRLSKEFRTTLEAHLYGVEKFGALAHCRSRGFHSVYGMKRYLEGLIAFARYIDSNFGQTSFERIRRARW